jgi:predicted DNA-binding transcriptional regulator YafY
VVRRRKVRLSYTNNSRELSERLIDPWGLVDKDDVWYLLAGTERGQPTFRVDRIEERRSCTWAAVLIQARFVPVLHDQFGRHFRIDGELGDGRTRIRLAAPTPLDIARNLAGWGATIEVVEPRSVQAELARIGAELTARYPS